jgi:hypothetical protein
MKLTGYIILIVGIVLSLYDIWAAIYGITISNFMTVVLLQHPTAVFTLGFICGHWLGSTVYKNKNNI